MCGLALPHGIIQIVMIRGVLVVVIAIALMMDLEAQQVQDARRHRLVTLITLLVSQVVYYYNLIFLTPTAPILYHTSILIGEGWMLELLNGHPDRIWTCLGVGHDVFDKLVRVLIHDGIVEVARAPGAICRRSVHKYVVPSNHV